MTERNVITGRVISSEPHPENAGKYLVVLETDWPVDSWYMHNTVSLVGDKTFAYGGSVSNPCEVRLLPGETVERLNE